MNRILIKLGGSSLQNPETLKQLIELIKGLQQQQKDIILVHGGGPAINAELTSRGISWKFINGQRQTTPEMMSVIEEVLAGQINSMLVQILQAAGIQAFGHSGAQEQTLLCEQASAELMQVGKIQSVQTESIENIFGLNRYAVPVVAPIGIGAQQEKYNINADWAATKIAIALKVEKIIFLTDQDGLLDQNKELVTVATPELINEMILNEVISGGMYTKVLTMMEALNNGVKSVQVLNAKMASRILLQKNIGTVLTTRFAAVSEEVTPWITAN